METNLALQGYDPVSYFKGSGPVKGRSEFQTQWNNQKWYFTSLENQNLFTNDPEKYAPQFGGQCAFAVGMGGKAPGSPKAWKIVDGKLYLNANKVIQFIWSCFPNLISKAEKNWPKIKEGLK